MSASGHKRTFQLHDLMSALPPKADIRHCSGSCGCRGIHVASRKCANFSRPRRPAYDPCADRRGTETRTRVEAEYCPLFRGALERTAVPPTSLDRQRWQRLSVVGGGQFRLTAERTAGVYRARKRHLRFPPKGQKDLPPKADITQRELYARFVTKRDFSPSYCWFLHRGCLAVRPKTRKYSNQSGHGGSGQSCRTLRCFQHRKP